jgi:hypothetical protein
MYLEKNLNFHLVHHKSYRIVLESKEVLVMRGPRLTHSATAPSILATDARCQLFCILFLTSCILLSHGICSKFECTLGTIPLVRTCRHFRLFIKEYLTTVVQEMLSLVRQSLASLTVSWRGIVKKKCAQGVKSFTRMLDSKKIFAVYI